MRPELVKLRWYGSPEMIDKPFGIAEWQVHLSLLSVYVLISSHLAYQCRLVFRVLVKFSHMQPTKHTGSCSGRWTRILCHPRCVLTSGAFTGSECFLGSVWPLTWVTSSVLAKTPLPPSSLGSGERSRLDPNCKASNRSSVIRALRSRCCPLR